MSRAEWNPERGSYSLELVPSNNQLPPAVNLIVLPGISTDGLKELKRSAIACGVDPNEALTYMFGSIPALVLLSSRGFSLMYPDPPGSIEKPSDTVINEPDYIAPLQNISPIGKNFLVATEQLIVAGHVKIHILDTREATRRLCQLERSGETDIKTIKSTIADYWVTADIVAPE